MMWIIEKKIGNKFALKSKRNDAFCLNVIGYDGWGIVGVYTCERTDDQDWEVIAPSWSAPVG
jgi:hypothetical protein